MNPDSPHDPRSALEARLTALLLGELPPGQAAALEDLIARDAELSRLRQRLEHAITLLREVEAAPAAPAETPAAAPRLSEARRQHLLQHFKTIAITPKAAPRPARRRMSWLIPAAAAAALVMVVAGLLLPSMSRAKYKSMASRPTGGYLGGEYSERGAPPVALRVEPGAAAGDESRRAGGQQVPGLAVPSGGAPAALGRSLIVLPTGEAAGKDMFDASAIVAATPAPETISGGYTVNRDAHGGGGGMGGGGGYGTWSANAPEGKEPASDGGRKLGRQPSAQAQNFYAYDPTGSPTTTVVEGAPPENQGVQLKFAEGTEANRNGHLGFVANEPAPASPSTDRGVVAGQVADRLANAPVATAPTLRSELSKAALVADAGGGTAPAMLLETPAIAAGEHDARGYAAGGSLKQETEVLARRIEERKLGLVEPSLERAPAKRATAADELTPAKPAAPPPVPPPEVQTRDHAFSTFSLNVSDVSFKLAAASLEKGQMPDPATIRTEEFLNAFDYRDPEPPPGVPISFAWERARYPFAHNRDLLRFSIKTAAQGRQAGRPLNLVLLLDNSGSMERADRVQIIREALRVLATQLQPEDRLSVITFARTARLWVDGVPGDQAGPVAAQAGRLTPEGGTNLEDAMRLGYETARRHYRAQGINRVVLLTDGAANLGTVEPDALKRQVETHRQQGIALDCFGIGWDGYNDDLLETLARHGDGRYGFLNSPEEAASGFATQLAGALRVAASDVKVQVEFNPDRVRAYRQIGYAKHQLAKEQFRDNTVDAAEIGAAESGNALYVIETLPAGRGPVAMVRVRYKVPGTADYREMEWTVPYTGSALSLGQASPALRLAGAAGAFAEWLASSPFASEVTPDPLLALLRGVPELYGADARPKQLEWMIRQAKSIAGR